MIFGTACSVTPDVYEEQLTLAVEKVQQGLETGYLNATESSKLLVFSNIYVRYNPTTHCDYPKYEIYIFHGWHRVILLTNQVTQPILDEAITSSSTITIQDNHRTSIIHGREFRIFDVLPPQVQPITQTSPTP